MPAGRPRNADPGTLYTFAHLFYWDFRRLAEGSARWRSDAKQYDQLAAEAGKAQFTDREKVDLWKRVKEEVRAGLREEKESGARLRELMQTELDTKRIWLRMEAGEQSTKRLNIPGEPDVLKALLHAQKPKAIRRICKDAFGTRSIEVEPGRWKDVRVPNWPISAGSTFPGYLSEYATQFIEAKKDPRFPRSGRPSSLLKQLWFLSRALAGALYGVQVRTAINLVGSMRPEQVFKESRNAKQFRKGIRRRRKS